MNSQSFERNYYGVRQPQGFPGIPETWVTTWETLIATDEKTKLFALIHAKKDTPIRRVLLICHGFGEHSGRYLHFPHFLEQSVDAVYVYDQRGHGRSEGMRGDADAFDSLVADLEHVVRHVEKKYPGASIHLLGHSMGGLVALRLGFLYPNLPLKSYQISAPYLALFKEPALPLRAVAGLLARTWSTLSLTADVDPKVVSRDDRVIENYATDRLNHSRMTPRFYASMTAAQRDTRARKEGLLYPMVLHLPLADKLVGTTATRTFYEGLQGGAKRIFEYPDFRHEPMNDIGKETFFENLALVIDEAEKRK